MNDVLIIHPKYGGLGDHLLFSHLPRIAKETGTYKNVLISDKSPYRQQETKKIVWESNPYIDGFCNKNGLFFEEFSQIEEGMNLLDKLMLLHGMDDSKRFHEPELYIKPETISYLNSLTLYDPNYISNAGHISVKNIKEYIKKNNIKIDVQFSTRPEWRNYVIDNASKTISPKSIMEFISDVFSCKKLICLTTGTATVAAALGKKATVLYGMPITKIAHHSKLHEYINVQSC